MTLFFSISQKPEQITLTTQSMWIEEFSLMCYCILTVGLLCCQNTLISIAVNWLQELIE